jgi:Zn-dependent protease/predicted transcriptional regulator
MTMESSLQIGKVMGIPVRLHWSFILIIPWIAYIFSAVSDQYYGLPYGFRTVDTAMLRWSYSLIFAILLFVCVALHELGHSYIARVYGLSIRSITLYLFGGVAAMEEIPRNPKLELQMAFAGPAISGVLGLVFLLLYYQSFALLGINHPLTILLSTLGIVNLTLMAFNLLPAFPMDGGRVLRAWLATRTSYMAATNKAARIGKMFAAFMFLLGLFGGGLLIIIVAAFVYLGATEEERATTINICLEGIKVRDIMSGNVRTIPPGMNLKELTELIFREKHRGYPVMDLQGITGIITSEDIRKVPEDKRESTTVEEVMTRKIYDIAPDEEAVAAMKKLTELGIRRLPVMENGQLVGILSREDLVRAMELCSQG